MVLNLKRTQFRFHISKFGGVFTKKKKVVMKRYDRLHRDAMYVPSLEIFKVKLNSLNSFKLDGTEQPAFVEDIPGL